MDPRNTANAKRGYAEREQKRKLARKQSASGWQYEYFPKEENTMSQENAPNSKKFPWWLLVILGILVLSSCCCVSLIGGFLFPQSTPAVVEPTDAPAVVEPTDAPAVVEPTDAPAVVEPTACPTTGEAQALFGVNVQRIDTEACGWVWRGKPEHHSAICPTGYVCSFDVMNDVTVIHLGIDQTAEIYAGTFRLISAYPSDDAVHDVCALYLKEKAFAESEIPSFEVRFQAVPNLGPQSCPEQ